MHCVYPDLFGPYNSDNAQDNRLNFVYVIGEIFILNLRIYLFLFVPGVGSVWLV